MGNIVKIRFKTAIIMITIAVFLLLIPLFNIHANEFPYAGVIESSGTHFEITDSDYLNITLESSEHINIRLESVPEIVTMMIRAVSSSTPSTTLTIRGLAPLTTYYKYEDNYHNLAEFITDENGSFSYAQDISIPHIIFIQPRKSTKFIRNDATGGDCSIIGIWSITEKTCTLTQNLSETIQIDGDSITLDGNSFILSGSHTGSGIYLNGRSGGTIRNIEVRDFTYAISIYNSNNIHIENNNFTNIDNGAITLSNSHTSTITGNDVLLTVPSFRRHQGFVLFDSNINLFRDNTITLNIHADIRGGHQGILLFDSNNNVIDSNHVADTRQAVLLFDSYNNSIHGNTLANNSTSGLTIFSPSSGNEVYNNNFVNNPTSVVMSGGAINTFSSPKPVGGNYLSNYDTSAEGCDDTNSDNFCDLPYMFPGGQDSFPWTMQDGWRAATTTCTINCYSNVLFLPGLEASRLYRPEILQGQDEDQLWEPTRNEDVEQLYLSSTTGESLNRNIYTRDIIDESPQIINGYNIYKSFITFMNDEMVGEGIIDAWKAVPYDWRLDYGDILTSGRKTGDNISYLEATSTPYILQELRQLAETSRTGKVTIITHSNGGLLAKALIKKLKEENDPLFEKIDKLILVAVPQLGTPKAIEGLLHGDEAQIGAWDFGFLLDEEHGRELGENMQSAYNLLPSQKYFDTVQSPVVEFNFPTLYGDTINSALELRNFLLGDPQSDDPRIEPAPNDDESPNVLKPQFLDRAAENHNTVLDSWTPPASMEVIQIAGWGLKTIKSIEYSCNFLTCSSLSTLDRGMLMTHEGDGTVVLPSAVQMNGADRFYVNIRDHNKRGVLNEKKNRDHMNILEIDSLQKFIKNIISGNQDLEDDIYENEPTLKSSDKSIDFRLHSPVDIHLYDSQGNHAGLVQNPIQGSDLKAYEARIQNSYYKEFGETKYIGVGSEDTYSVELRGLDFGTFTLEIEESLGNEVLGKKVFEDIPTSPQMLASMTIQTLDTSPTLSIDIDSDGNTDVILTGNKNSDLIVSLKILGNIIRQINIHRGLKHDIVEKITQAKKELEKGKNKKTIEKLGEIIKKLESEIEKNLSTNGEDEEEDKHKQKISTEDVRVIIEIVEKLKANVIE